MTGAGGIHRPGYEPAALAVIDDLGSFMELHHSQILLFRFWFTRLSQKRGSDFPDIPEQVPDVDPDEEFVALLLLILDLLLDDAIDGGVLASARG